MLAGTVITGGVVSAAGVNVPNGAVVCKDELSPQQTAVPSVLLMAHVWLPPEETSLNVPAGGVA
jgi:hypothetical protein